MIYDADLRMALERDPKDVRVRLAVASHVRRLARATAAVPGSRWKRDEYVQEAVRQYEQILQTEPDNEAAFLQLGNLYFEQGDVDNALKTWKRGVAQPANESSLILWQHVVRGHLAKGSFTEAEDAMDRLDLAIRELNPRLAREGRAQLRQERKLLEARFEFAKKDYAEATSQLEDFVSRERPAENRLADAQLMLFQGYLSLQRWDDAVSAFRTAARIEGIDLSTLLAAAQSLAEAGRTSEARQCFGLLSASQQLPLPQQAEVRLRPPKPHCLSNCRCR